MSSLVFCGVNLGREDDSTGAEEGGLPSSSGKSLFRSL